MRKLVKVSAMLAIAAIMQIGGCKLAYAERGYKAKLRFASGSVMIRSKIFMQK